MKEDLPLHVSYCLLLYVSLEGLSEHDTIEDNKNCIRKGNLRPTYTDTFSWKTRLNSILINVFERNSFYQQNQVKVDQQ